MSILTQMVLIEKHGLRVDLERLAVILETTAPNLRRKISDGSTLSQAYTDDYTETFDTGVTLDVTQSGTTVTVIYTTTNTGSAGTLTYSLSHLA